LKAIPLAKDSLAPKNRQYSDGSPLDEIHYLECKLILKPDRFTSAKVFLEFNKLVGRVAREFGVGFPYKDTVLKPQIREVLFLDTAGRELYNNAFILRRRILYEDGFPVGDPEIVFKFRHPDLQKAAEIDVRPDIAGSYRIKFKAEALPLKDRIDGYRLLFSHNAQFGLSQAPEGSRTSLSSLARLFPALGFLKTAASQRVEIVNNTFVEEVLQDLGKLNFGKGIAGAAQIAIWRERATHRPLCGEFSFEAKFKRGVELHDTTVERGKQLFIKLQQFSRDWLLLGTTKTGLVYRLNGDPLQGQE
jgi:hypothetical protein